MSECYQFAEIEKIAGKLALTNSQKVELAEYYLLNNFDNIATELPLKHHINSGLYAREIFLPKGILLTGKVHNYDHLSVISNGDVTVLDQDGLNRIKGPHTWHSPAGTKRLIYVHEDTVWTTFHVTNLKTVEELEKHLTHESDLTWIKEIDLLSGDII